jgi:hypothetical protein|tara:strand:- start:399 stop:575 length:177 start_codon:yes stop_codon:yes gene_type:complete
MKEVKIDKDMEIVNEKIKKAFEDADLKSMDFGETKTITLSGLFDHIDFEADFDEEDEE